jgi:hypothetical protein
VDDTLAQLWTAAASGLALVLSLANLYLQRRDQGSRLAIRVRYEYRAGTPEGSSEDKGHPPLRIHDDSQEGLYLLLGDFLREHELAYPQGSPVVRFSLSNEGQREIFLDTVRLVFHSQGRWPRSGEMLVLDPAGDRVLPLDLAEGLANVLVRDRGDRGGELPVRLPPGDGVGYKFELVRLANTLGREGYSGNVRLALEVADRLGNVHRRRFYVNTDLWAYPDER